MTKLVGLPWVIRNLTRRQLLASCSETQYNKPYNIEQEVIAFAQYERCSHTWRVIFCRVWHEADDDWYEAVVRGYDRRTKLHNLWYPYDEEVGFVIIMHCRANLCIADVAPRDT